MSDEEGTLDMEWLRYDRKSASESEYFLRTHDRVKGAKSRIIERDRTLGNSCLHECLLHIFRFVVTRLAIVS